MQIPQHIIVQQQTRHISQTDERIVVQRRQIVREDHQLPQRALIAEQAARDGGQRVLAQEQIDQVARMLERVQMDVEYAVER